MYGCSVVWYSKKHYTNIPFETNITLKNKSLKKITQTHHVSMSIVCSLKFNVFFSVVLLFPSEKKRKGARYYYQSE